MKKKLLLFFYYLVAIPVLLEVLLLVLGYSPYINDSYSIQSTPNLILMGHPKLGLCLNPGEYGVTINKGLHYFATHTNDSLRFVPNQPLIYDSSIFMFGCSYTYGMGVNDDKTFSSILQKNKPSYKILNYGVPGYGTVQTYLQIKELIRSKSIKKSDLVIINYISFHNQRNALTPEYRKQLKIGYERSNKRIKSHMKNASFPYINYENKSFTFETCNWSEVYDDLVGRETFASINLLQNVIDNTKTKKIPEKEISLFLFNQINTLLKENNILLIVNGLSNNSETEFFLNDLKKYDIKTISSPINLKDTVYNNFPYDEHPNIKAHDLIANQIYKKLKH